MNLEKTTHIRTCIACGRKERKCSLVRIVRMPSGAICADESGRLAGRGAYVCNEVCLDKVVQSGRLSRALKASPTEDELTALIAVCRQHEKAAGR